MAERWYYIIGAALALVVLATVVWSVQFVIKTYNTAVHQSLITTEPPVTFNVDKLKELLEKK